MKRGRLWRVSKDHLDAFLWGNARTDFAEPLTPEEAAESDAAWRAYLERQDPGESLAEVGRALLEGRRVGARWEGLAEVIRHRAPETGPPWTGNRRRGRR